ncbi:amino acid adenylation domain-containing protein [Nonomuraea thailandensis]|uniref:Amino acid adenylation domain-containing protein n=1 Tax=Nonomuraea thailandensis TaxID=1188745 RepID=A0A9X2K374_9ACTN|nr:non-ribosomal peptide synthetase [Nonomuraea thailandensis]MCP2357820.1 amino acid adenylation domain-containing protein [Nonomuraea thailandensis]
MVPTSVHGHLAEQAARTPDAIAVSGGPATLTYRELDERANRLAHRLRGLGVGPETPVAVLMERSAELVVALLGILKAGGCYLPVHSAYPPDRQQWILDSSGAPVLLADRAKAGAGLPFAPRTLVLDEPAERAETDAQPSSAPAGDAQPDNLAYVIYTSGSTGRPKGVAVTHGDVLGLALDRCWDTGNHERVLMVAPYAFNVSTYELWVPLLHGGRIVAAPPGELDLAVLKELVTREEITALHLTAGLFRVVAEEGPGWLAGVREVLTGGDVIVPSAVRQVHAACPDTVVRAMYGATEVTLFSTTAELRAGAAPAASVPVGGPMDEVRLYVLDDRLSPVPGDLEGELYIGGRGVARGYFGRADLTAERFVADPFAGSGGRMYRTGDLVRRNGDGQIEFIGRAGDQVKILGFRVELAEVEAAVASFPGLAHAAVVARELREGEKRLVAYVVPAGEPPAVGTLRAHVKTMLPDYMVPAAFVLLDALPLTANGKVDRASLPDPEPDTETAYRAPLNPRQEVLCSVFADVFGVDQIGIDDSIFDLDVQSLLAMRLVNRISTTLDVELTIGDLFDAPTVASLDEWLESAVTGQ